MKLIYHLIIAILLITIPSCKKFVEIDAPVTSINERIVYNNDITATAVLTGLYSILSSTPYFGSGFMSITRYAGLSADELDVWGSYSSESGLAYYRNKLFTTLTSSPGSETWLNLYPLIIKCNQAIEELDQSQSLSSSTKQQLLGEARFLRALFYFYLVNLYGEVPLVTTFDYKVNRLLKRSQISDVYAFIISELNEAKALLSPVYLDGKLKPYVGNIERVRPTKWAASALLARTYLYIGDFAKAEMEATSVIDNSLYGLTGLTNIFLKNSQEAIWQLQPVIPNSNTEDAKLFVLTEDPVGFSDFKPFYLNSSLVNAFEAGDDRKTKWIGEYTSGSTTYFFPYKYKLSLIGEPIDEYYMVLRLAEQYLIRAEANARQNKLNLAINDLNTIRNRARAISTLTVPNPLPALPDNLSQNDVISAVMQERRVELFAELGQRWLDLKRTNKVNDVMNSVTTQKGGTWQPFQAYYPIDLTELQKAPNLVQNSGY
ncbi:RagB/SusD family nutrient uptake outer membrane protein [Niastella sp. OAS944]|uniref:RagB/SusD family nutrient uptake outer membrane protein n=1 Tax=Niastella sp. OAS944 TaxID=2664089 RepID=UPI00348E68E2|nr:hypothetical protein [Chitinophagaceae bacterium OAS944]